MARGYKAIFGNGKIVAEYEDGALKYVDQEYWSRNRSHLSAPMVMRDIREYTSPIDGAVITSRSAHREHMRAHDVIEVGNERMPIRTDTPPTAKEIGMEIKRHIEQVKAMPEPEYQSHIAAQQAEHSAIASQIVPG